MPQRSAARGILCLALVVARWRTAAGEKWHEGELRFEEEDAGAVLTLGLAQSGTPPG